MDSSSLTTAVLTAGGTEYELPLLEQPFSELTIENATDVMTLDYNVYTDFISTKRQWRLTWSFLTQPQYDLIKNIYNSQFTLFNYPLLTVPYYPSITNVPVRMSINEKNVVNVAGGVEGVEITLRETVQTA